MIRYSCHSENFGILSAEHTFSLIHDLQFDCIDIASRSLIPQNQIQADPAATSAYLKDLSQRYELPLSELFLSEVEVNGEKNPSCMRLLYIGIILPCIQEHLPICAECRIFKYYGKCRTLRSGTVLS